MTDRDDARTKAAFAVEEAMKPVDRYRLLTYAVSNQPAFEGARVADVLDLYDDHDALLGWREPFTQKHGPRVDAALDIEVGSPTNLLRGFVAMYATLACAVLMEGEPLPQDVIELARNAVAIAEDDIVRPALARSDLPDLPAGVYRHYKGPLYLVFGYGHDANADTLFHVRVDATHLGERYVVVYVGLQLDDAHDGPRIAVRDVADFHALVCGVEACERYGEVFEADPYNGCVRCKSAPVKRFTYIGPEWAGESAGG